MEPPHTEPRDWASSCPLTRQHSACRGSSSCRPPRLSIPHLSAAAASSGSGAAGAAGPALTARTAPSASSAAAEVQGGKAWLLVAKGSHGPREWVLQLCRLSSCSCSPATWPSAREGPKASQCRSGSRACSLLACSFRNRSRLRKESWEGEESWGLMEPPGWASSREGEMAIGQGESLQAGGTTAEPVEAEVSQVPGPARLSSRSRPAPAGPAALSRAEPAACLMKRLLQPLRSRYVRAGWCPGSGPRRRPLWGCPHQGTSFPGAVPQVVGNRLQHLEGSRRAIQVGQADAGDA